MTTDRLRTFARVEKALRWSAALVLVVGFTSSVLVWRAQDRLERQRAGRQGGDFEAQLSPLDSRKQLRDLEWYGGWSAVLLEEAKGWFHGKALAKTIGIASVITAAGLFLVTVRRGE